MKSAAHTTLYGSYDTTDVGPVYEPTSPVTSGAGETDIIYKYYTAPMTDYGITYCDDNSIGNGRCDQFYIYLNSTFLNSVAHQAWYTDFTRALACHETGHAVGLTHGYNADPPQSDQLGDLHCMRRGMYAANQTDFTVGGQNTAMINSVYS